MKKKKMIIMVIVLLIIMCGILLGFKYNYDFKQTDNYKFGNEYHTSLNNNVKYINTSKALEIMHNDEAVIYIGSATDETCQKIVPLLIDVVNKYHINHFYYLNIDDDVPAFDITDEKLVKTKDGSEDYYKLLEILDPLLKEKIIKKDGKDYKTNEKTISIPSVITVKNGNIDNYHEGTVTLNKDQLVFDEKNQEQRLRLIDIYSDMITKLNV